MRKKILLIAFSFLWVGMVHAAIINVPADYSSIQSGINASTDGDTVLVQPGLYEGNIDFYGNDITLASLYLTTQDTSYISQTVIKGVSGAVKVIDIGWGSEISPVLCGFTIRNVSDNKRNIQISNNASPIIMNNRIYFSNSSNYCGIYMYESSPTIEGNVIIGNQLSVLSTYGIQVGSESENVTIRNNEIKNVDIGIQLSSNTSTKIINNLISNCREGIWSFSSSSRFINNTIVNNSHYGFFAYGSSQPELINCILYGNTPNVYYDAHFSCKNCCIEEGVPLYAEDLGGNISGNPCFADTITYHLLVISPCIDAGTIDTASLNLGEFDLYGNERIQDGNGDGNIIIDIGCVESSTVDDPGFISGSITLNGGPGNIEDVKVGVGTPVHPNEDGDYIITIDASSSPYNVTAWLDGYLPQMIYDVEVNSGQLTDNIDFELEAYQPDTLLDFTPDSLFFITDIMQELSIKNISLIDVYITGFSFSSYQFYCEELPFPQLLTYDDSLTCFLYLNVPIDEQSKFLESDSMYVYTDAGQFIIPITWNTDLINGVSELDVNDYLLNLNSMPNPTKNSTIIKYSLKQNSHVNLSIYNIKGQLISTLVNEDKPKGEHAVVYHTDTLNSGVYFYKIRTKEISEIKKMIVIK